jgi:hypothetical protein
MSGSLPIIHEEPHPPVAPSPQALRVGEGLFYYGCLTELDITHSWWKNVDAERLAEGYRRERRVHRGMRKKENFCAHS